jgi:DNA-binding transcriptional ArsR family regulator
MDALFHALSNESRRRMLDIMRAEPGIGVGRLAGKFDVSRIAVMKHLAVLETANLVISEKVGRTRRLYFNVTPIQMIHDRWSTEYSAYWAGQVAQIKNRAEARHADDNKKRIGAK